MKQKMILPTPSPYDHNEIEAVERVLATNQTNYWTGEEGKIFEEEFSAWCGAKHGLCVFNGTAALEIAIKACGISQGDEVVVTPRSFLASAAAVVAVGATPVFADVDLDSGNITPDTIQKVITQNTRAIIPVHLGGWPADIPSIMELANAHGIKVIEDCAQAHGATINDKRVGSLAHASAFSFCQDKIMSTGGEGGMIVTNDDQTRDVAWSLRDHGRNREQTLSDDHNFGFRWTQERIGTNARMTEIQAAIGRCQLQKIDVWLRQRAENAKNLAAAMGDLDGIKIPLPPENMSHAYYRFTTIFDSGDMRDRVVQQLNSVGIPATTGPCPEIYRENAFVQLGITPSTNLSVAHDLGKRSMALPVYPGIETALSAINDHIATVCA